MSAVFGSSKASLRVSSSDGPEHISVTIGLNVTLGVPKKAKIS
jgi:hypothetical protein